MPLMLSLDRIQRELKAILDFDIIFSAENKHYPAEIIGFEVRQWRKRELLQYVELLHIGRTKPCDSQSLPIPPSSPNVGDVAGVDLGGCRRHRRLRRRISRPKQKS